MHKYIVILVTAILLNGCQTQTTTSNNVYENIESADVELAVVETVDPLVEYALNNIKQKFVSDDGYYRSWRDIRKYIDDDKVEKQIELITAYIEIQDFEGLRQIILDIPDYNNYVKEIKMNYIVPILMSEDNYIDALRIVQSKYVSEYKKGRFRFDTLYLERYLYLNHGFDYSRNLIDELLKEFPNDDLSYVWFAITEKNFYDLYTNGICMPVVVDGEQYELLKYLIENYPEDPFIDHAYYYIGDYDTIINDFPDSDILDRALYAKAYVAYQEAKGTGYFYYDPDIIIDPDKIEIATGYFFEYLERYPNSRYAEDAINKLLTLYTAHYRITNDDHYYYNLIEKVMKLPYITSENESNLLGQITYLIRREYIESGLYIGLESDSMVRLNSIQMDETYRTRILTGLAHNAFKFDELQVAFTIFDMGEFEYFGYWEKARYDTLFDLYYLIDKADKDSLFETADILRDNDEYTLSILYYSKLENMDLNDEELSKAKMLKASSYREVDDSKNMIASYQYIVDNLSKTKFADDALAEIGVYYLLDYREKDSDKAREIFEQVISEYPNTNSINNAYNWIAWSYLQEKRYEEALVAYEELRDKFPLNRLGINARFNIMKIKDILED